MNNQFKIYAISVIKNEGDIIAASLEYAKQWFDKIIVYDNGSTDKTWDIVNQMADEQIIPFKYEKKEYSDALRSEVFNAYKAEMDDGDWWAIQDADEFFLENPKKIISQYSDSYQVIASKKIDFVLEKDEATNFLASEFDPSLFHYCKKWAWSEMRLFKHRKRLMWVEGEVWPKRLGKIAPYQINIKHYPTRSVEQIKLKFYEKKLVSKNNPLMFRHLLHTKNWIELLPSKNKLINVDEKGSLNIFSKVKTRNNLADKGYKRLIITFLQLLKIWP